MSSLLTGCASTEYVFVYQGLTDDYDKTRLAVQEWNDCGEIHISLVSSGSGDTVIQHVPNDYTRSLFANPKVQGLTSGDRSLIQYKSTENTQRDLAHEMGHALGLKHSAEGIMRAYPDDHVMPVDCDALNKRDLL